MPNNIVTAKLIALDSRARGRLSQAPIEAPRTAPDHGNPAAPPLTYPASATSMPALKIAAPTVNKGPGSRDRRHSRTVSWFTPNITPAQPTTVAVVITGLPRKYTDPYSSTTTNNSAANARSNIDGQPGRTRC